MNFESLIIKLTELKIEINHYENKNSDEIQKGASLELAKRGDISFLEKNNKLLKELNQTRASAILIPNDKEIISMVDKLNISWASITDTKLAFAYALNILHPDEKFEPRIHPSAVIEKSTKINEKVFLGANVTVGGNCFIDEGTIIHPGVVIYNNVLIGKNVTLHANCVIHKNSIIGDKTIIHSNAVIGSEGFGFVPTKNGWVKMPQTGRVIIGKKVEIGCNSAIDRPAVGKTQIKDGTKLDNLVQIGHGVTVGENCAFAAQVGIAGGANISQNVILAGQVGVGNRVNVGQNVIASSKCGIHADVEQNQIVSGFPAMPNKLWLRCQASFKKLPIIAKSLRSRT